MHEASAAESIVRIVRDEVEARHVACGRDLRVMQINLVVGETTGYMRESLEFYVGVFASGTCAEGASLSVRYVKPTLRCPSCGLEYERLRFSFACPSCGEDGVMTGTGGEFYVDSIEVARPPEAGHRPIGDSPARTIA